MAALMTKIAIDFLRGPGILSWSIADLGRGPNGWSHCASVLADGRYLDARHDALRRVDPTCDVPDRVPAGIHIRDPQSEQWIRKRRWTLEVTQIEYDDWEANLRAKIGDLYASWDIVGFLVSRMLHRPATYDCSALVVNALQHIQKIVFPLPVPAHQLTPNDAQLLVAQAGFQRGPTEYPEIS